MCPTVVGNVEGKNVKNVPKICTQSEIQQWLVALNCKPKRSLNQCHFIITFTVALNKIISHFASAKTDGLQTKAWILNSYVDSHDTKHTMFVYAFFFASLVTRGDISFVIETLATQYQPTNSGQKVFERVTNNINYIILAKEINYAFSMEIYYSVSKGICCTFSWFATQAWKLIYKTHTPQTHIYTNTFASLCLVHGTWCSLVRINLAEIEFSKCISKQVIEIGKHHWCQHISGLCNGYRIDTTTKCKSECTCVYKSCTEWTGWTLTCLDSTNKNSWWWLYVRCESFLMKSNQPMLYLVENIQ